MNSIAVFQYVKSLIYYCTVFTLFFSGIWMAKVSVLKIIYSHEISFIEISKMSIEFGLRMTLGFALLYYSLKALKWIMEL